MSVLRSISTNMAFALAFFAPLSSSWASVLFNDVATLPDFKSVGAVVQTDNNGLWRISRETPAFADYKTREPLIATSENSETLFSFLTNGGSFYVEKLPPFTTERIKLPTNISPGTVLSAESGRVFKNIDGSYFLSTTSSEDVYIYKHSGVTWAAFKSTGVVLKIELLSGTPIPDPQPTPDCPPARFDAATNKVIVPCLEIQGAGSKLVFETEWNLTSGTDGVLTLKLQRAVPK